MNPRTIATRAAEWIKADGARTIRIATVSFGISWLINFAIITSRGESYGDVVATTTTGNIPLGIVYWGVLSATVAALVVYGLEVGWSELWASIKAFPGALARLFKEEGPKAWSLFLWAGAIALAISGVLTPTLSAVFGLGFLALTPTAVMGILGRVVSKIWAGVLGAFAPKDKPRAPGLGGQFVGVVGSTVGFLIASRSPSVAFKLISAAALAVVSYIALTGTTSKATKLLGLGAMAGAWWLLSQGVAEALGGCCGGSEDHHHGIEKGGKAAGLSGIGGAAAAAGGVAGGGVGGALGGTAPVDPSTIEWGDEEPPDGGDGGAGGSGGSGGGGGSPGSDDGATVTPGVDAATPTTPRTIILEGDDAQAALDAWNDARDQGGTADIPIPHDEQWDLVITDEDGNPVVRQGHSGTRGEITGINIVAEGDGDLVINIDVSTYNPAGETPPDPIMPGEEPAPAGGDAAAGGSGGSGATDSTHSTDSADSSDPVDSGDPPPPPPPPPDTDATEPTDTGTPPQDDADDTDDTGPTATPPPPDTDATEPTDTDTPPQDDDTDDTDDTGPTDTPPPPPPPPEDGEEIPPVENQVPPPPPPPPADGGDDAAAEPEQKTPADKTAEAEEEWPDPKDTEAFSDWAESKLEEWGIMDHEDATAVGDFLGDPEQGSVTVSGEFGGLPGQIISRVENTSTGVAIHTPTRDEIHVEVVGGKIRVRHEASMIGLIADQVMEGMQAAGADIPDIDEIMVRANRTVDAFNQSLGGTDRIVTGIQTDPDNPNGPISIQTGPKP